MLTNITSFSGAGGTAEQDILVASDKGTSRQVLDEGAIDAWRGVQVRQRLVTLATGLGQATRETGLVATFQFVILEPG